MLVYVTSDYVVPMLDYGHDRTFGHTIVLERGFVDLQVPTTQISIIVITCSDIYGREASVDCNTKEYRNTFNQSITSSCELTSFAYESERMGLLFDACAELHDIATENYEI